MRTIFVSSTATRPTVRMVRCEDAYSAVAYFTPIPAKIEPWAVVLGIGMTAGVGLFFGLYPAIRASRLDPIESLRYE